MKDDKIDGLLDSLNTGAGSLDDDLLKMASNKPKRERKDINFDVDRAQEMLDNLNKGGQRQAILKDKRINVARGVGSSDLGYKRDDDNIEIDIDKMTKKEKKAYFRVMDAHEFDIEDLLGYPGDFRKIKFDKKFKKKFRVYRCKKVRRVFVNPNEFADFFLEYHNQDKLAEFLLSDKKFYAFLRAHSGGDVEYRLQYKRFIQLVSTIFKEVDFSGEL